MTEQRDLLGWSGRMDQVEHYLKIIGADRTSEEEGNLIILGGPGIFSFLGLTDRTADVLIPHDTVYFMKGRPAGLAAGLRSTSYGVGVAVIV